MTPPFDLIKEHYERLTPLIIARHKRHPMAWEDPMMLNGIMWESMFTPIEKEMWRTIRDFGKVPMYPQYPVGRFFIDFANPFWKIGIECDGKDFHKDKQRDADRDAKLDAEGWRIFRISGSDCMKYVEPVYYKMSELNPQDQALILGKYYETPEGLLTALAIMYLNYDCYNKEEGELQFVEACLRERETTRFYKRPQ